MRGRFLLDTNQLSQAVSPTTKAALRLRELRLTGAIVGTSVAVMCEIEAGIQNVRDETGYRSNLARVLQQVRIWPLDLAIAAEFGRLHADLRRLGRVLSQVDMMLAATARQMRLTLVTSDQDFEAVPDIVVEDWTK